MQTEIKAKVVFVVLACHILAISLLFITTNPKEPVKKPNKILIQNVKLTPKQEKFISWQEIAKTELIEPVVEPVVDKPIEDIIAKEDKKEEAFEKEKIVVKEEKKEEVQKDSKKKIEASKKEEKKAPSKKTDTKKPESKPLKEEKKKESVEKPKKAEVKKIEPKKETKKVDHALLKNIEENIAKIGKKADKPSQKKDLKLDLPQAISSLNIETDKVETVVDIPYEDEIRLFLKASLILPEFGDVKIKLTVKRSGKVTLVEVLKSESKKNKEYLEESLLKLKLPSFGKHFLGLEEKSFTLTLSNAV